MTVLELLDQRIAELDRLIDEVSAPDRRAAEHGCFGILRANLRALRQSKMGASYAPSPVSNLIAMPTAQPRQHWPAPMKAAPSADLQGPICPPERRRAAGESRDAGSLSKNTAAPASAATGQGKSASPAAADERMARVSSKVSQTLRDGPQKACAAAMTSS